MIYNDETTCADVLAEWDRGGSIWSIEMGGLGPGYEQAIQVLAIELVRDNVGKPMPTPQEAKDWKWGDDTVSRVDSACLGFSGAQVGAAKHIAYKWLTDGYGIAMRKAREQFKRDGVDDRFIQVSNRWPRVEPAKPAQHGEQP